MVKIILKKNIGNKSVIVRETDDLKYWGEISSPRMSRPRLYNFGKNRDFAIRHMTEKADNLKYYKNQILERRQKIKNMKNPYKKGDILYSSWGYDQTNVNFFQVIKTKPKSVVLRSISGDYTETGFMSGQTKPKKNVFVRDFRFGDSPFLKKVGLSGTVKIDQSRYASKWKGGTTYESYYA